MIFTSLLDKLIPKKSTPKRNEGFFQTLTAYRPVFRSWDGSIYESELCRAAIDARARAASKLKIEVIGTGKPHLQTKLRYAPNDWQTWSQFLYRLSTILDCQNSAFIIPVLNEFGETTGFYPILPSRCEVVQFNGDPWLRYTFRNGQTAALELSRCGIMTKFQYGDDLFGENNRALSPTMELISIQNQGISEGVKSSATFRFMAKLNNFTSPDDLAEERKLFNKTNLKDDGGGLLLFPNTYTDIKQIESKPFVVDAKQMEAIAENVKNYFSVSTEILQSKAYGDAWSAFYESVVEPFSIQLSEVLTRMAFSPRECAQGSAIMATSNRLQYMTNTEKLNVSAQLADRGIMNRDEIREIWNLPPLPNGEGKAYIIRGEYKNAVDTTTEEDNKNEL